MQSRMLLRVIKSSFFLNRKNCIKLILGHPTEIMVPILFGLLIGALVAGIPLATMLTIYLQQQSKQSIDTFLKSKIGQLLIDSCFRNTIENYSIKYYTDFS
jgi:hypothetical protein